MELAAKDSPTNEVVSRICKIKGLNIRSSAAQEEIQPDTMEQLVKAMRKNTDMTLNVKQQSFKINSKDKTISAQQIHKKLSNNLSKRFCRFDISPTLTFSYGVSSFDRIQPALTDFLTKDNVSEKRSENDKQA